jgi:hypothetical protein
MALSPDKNPLLDNVAITLKASPHTSTPLAEKTCINKIENCITLVLYSKN